MANAIQSAITSNQANQEQLATSGLNQWAQSDPNTFDEFVDAANKGDGNGMMEILKQELQKGSGGITQQNAHAIFEDIQSTATANGGGTLDGGLEIGFLQADGETNLAPSFPDLPQMA